MATRTSTPLSRYAACIWGGVMERDSRDLGVWASMKAKASGRLDV